jgi:hypothetical protein
MVVVPTERYDTVPAGEFPEIAIIFRPFLRMQVFGGSAIIGGLIPVSFSINKKAVR